MITRLPARCAAFYPAALLNNRMKSLESRQARPGGRRVDPNVILPHLRAIHGLPGGGGGARSINYILDRICIFTSLCCSA